MNKTIGIFGGGQLGRMMAQAALPLNIQCSFFEAETDCPAAILGPVFSSKNPEALQDFIASADVFSLEFENTPVADVDVLTQTKTLHPPRLALATAQNRLAEKSLFDELGIPVAPYRAVDIGGATTDVYSIAEGKPTIENVIIKGLPEPFSKRTVEGDLGMRYSLSSLSSLS